MRHTAQGSWLRVKAIAGTHVVILAWDFTAAARPRAAALCTRRNLLGFAIERTEFDAQGRPVERYWLRGIKRFEHKDQGQPAGAQMPTSEHPVQTFQWGDYGVEPGTRYRYRVVPVFGQPKLLQLDSRRATGVDVRTEPEGPAAGAAPSHDVYFNRGVIGSQAYARRFGNAAPQPDEPHSPEMTWLSRGLYEALLAFIGRARGERFALRGAFYEFRYRPVARALRAAIESGADVRIVYDAESSYKAENEATVRAAGLDDFNAVIPRTVTEGIRHNKFLVLLDGGQPVAVWTGSTNLSAGGIFGHSNVGHVLHDPVVAAAFLAYWERLAANLTPTQLRAPNVQASPLPSGPPWQPGVTALFSPRDPAGSETTLKWYADRMAEATRLVCFTVAFDIDPLFQQVLSRDNDVLRYIVKDDDLASGESIGRDRDVLFAAGGKLDEGALAGFLAERGNPLNTNDYIHTKVMLVDPLGPDPLVVSGSANFSRASQWRNDENMLVIRGDARVADCYFGEFMRIFDHHYARYLVRKLAGQPKAPGAGYLREQAADWLGAHLDDDSPKGKRRRYFTE